MDPALHELIAEGAADEEVAVVVRLRENATPPAGLRLVARFGPIATARAARADLVRLHADPAIASLKAPRLYSRESEPEGDPLGAAIESDPAMAPSDIRRPAGLAERGRGTVVCVIDWTLDFAHPDFRNADGTSRLLALWDQGGRGTAPPRYGYGVVHDRAAINHALHGADPFGTLGYGSADGSHGTHVLGIAAGNGRAGGPEGVAPEAELIFIHLGSGGGDLGSSVELLEAIDFAAATAGDRPLVINMSLGRHAGPHDGTLLVERAIDWLLLNRLGTAVVQSTGNYYSRSTHMSGRLSEARIARLPFRTAQRDSQPIVVEIWYRGSDEFTARVRGPDGSTAAAALGANTPVLAGRREIGRLYHRRGDPNNGDNLVNLFLRPDAASGTWELEIEGVDVVDGRWHAWIERNAGCFACQAQFLPNAATAETTTGSICNAMRTIAVGAYDAGAAAPALPDFSSVGPTRDGRRKPLLVAPGVRILSVRSRADATAAPGYVRMSGTSMASPAVAGTAALMMEAAGRQRVTTLRRVLFSSLRAAPGDDPRWGYGILDIQAAVAGARSLAAPRPAHPTGHESDERRASAEAEFASSPFSSSPEALRQDPAPAVTPAWEMDGESLLRRAVDPGDDFATVVGWSGRRLASPLEPGDLLIRSGAPGELPHVEPIADPVLISRSDLARLRLVADGPWPGGYVRLAGRDGAEPRFARRVTAPDGFVPQGLMIVRPGLAGETVAPFARPTLRRGSSGPAVAELQSKLNAIDARWKGGGLAGIERCPIDVDGRFGPMTQQATLSFQRHVFAAFPGEWDGVVGPKTWEMVDGESAEVPPVPVPPPPPPPGPHIIPTGGVVLPVIVLPGIMGTRLSLVSGPDWDPDRTTTMLRWLAADGADKLVRLDFRSAATILRNHSDPGRQRRGWGALAATFYADLLEGLERGLAAPHPCAGTAGFVAARHPVWAFGYDWRQSNASHAARLNAFIDEVLETERAQQVILVTHSMGGLVVRAALPLIADRVLGVVHTVQPAVGAVAAARRVHTGFHPTIDRQLGELLQEMAEALGSPAEQMQPLRFEAGEPVEMSWVMTRVFTAIFSDSLVSPNPIYYGRLMARVPSAVELMPSDAAGAAAPTWLRPRVPAGSIHDHYAVAPRAAGGMILPGLPAADAAELRLRIAQAKLLHASLGYHPRTGVLFGTQLLTDFAFDPAAPSPEIIAREGDGTVAAFSARCPDLAAPLFRVGFPRVEHGECFKNAAFLAATVAGVDHIAQGRAPLREGVRPDRSACLMIA